MYEIVGNNLSMNVQWLYIEHYNILLREIKEGLNK